MDSAVNLELWTFIAHGLEHVIQMVCGAFVICLTFGHQSDVLFIMTLLTLTLSHPTALLSFHPLHHPLSLPPSPQLHLLPRWHLLSLPLSVFQALVDIAMTMAHVRKRETFVSVMTQVITGHRSVVALSIQDQVRVASGLHHVLLLYYYILSHRVVMNSELEEGQCCTPGGQDAYCSFTGVCEANGLWCNCFNDHFWSSERCAYWHDDTDPDPQPDECPPPLNFFPTVVPTSEPTFTWKPSNVPSASPTYFRDPCNPGSRGYCSNRGFCSETGECECDDPLHYWPSELCSTYHPGPELEDGQCCTPGKVGYYCSWIGRCHDHGGWCICPSGFWAEERCSTWHNTSDPNPEPDLCPGATYPPSGQPSNQPSGQPSNQPSNQPSGQPSAQPSGQPSDQPSGQPSNQPSGEPSVQPSTQPSSIPSGIPSCAPTSLPSTSAPTSCLTGDRSVCNNNGACGPSGNGCRCDDSEHYWPSEQCSTFHEGPELLPGQYCTPNTRNSYCSWLGVCSSDGLSCLCDDPEHRSSSDRCDIWYPLPSPSTGLCTAGDRAPCHNRGTCDSSTGENVCTCDDPGRYWPSEFCSEKHFGGELTNDNCCIPGERDYYCAWLGVCDVSGDLCHCNVSHRWASERCATWHVGDDPDPPVEGDDCPLLIFDGPTTSSADSADVFGLSSSVFYSVAFFIGVLLLLTAFALRRRYTTNEVMRDSSFTYDHALGGESGNFNVKSPYLATKAAGTLDKMGLEKAGEYIRKKSLGYEDVNDDNGDVELPPKPSNFSKSEAAPKESILVVDDSHFSLHNDESFQI